MQIQIIRNINDIDPIEWDSVVSSNEPFNSHRFLKSLQNGKVENANYYFLIIKKDNQLLANAVLSCFYINLDLFIGDNKLINLIKKLKPNAFKLNILFCGTPVSIGHKNISYLPDKINFSDVIAIIAKEADKIAKENKIRFCIFKEFFEPEATNLEQYLSSYNYFRGFSLPYIELPIRWKTFEEYVDQLKSSYRRQLVASLKKINTKAPVFVEDYYKSKKDEAFPVFTILKSNQFSPQFFFELYMSVMGRATTKLEILNEPFFEAIFRNMDAEIEILAMVFKGEILGATLLVDAHPELTFVWTGRSQAKDIKYDNYFNLLTAMVHYAIQKKYKILHLGQTAYYTKQRLGGHPENLFIFFKSYSWFWHQFVKVLKNTFFPDLKLNKIKSLKE